MGSTTFDPPFAQDMEGARLRGGTFKKDISRRMTREPILDIRYI